MNLARAPSAAEQSDGPSSRKLVKAWNRLYWSPVPQMRHAVFGGASNATATDRASPAQVTRRQVGFSISLDLLVSSSQRPTFFIFLFSHLFLFRFFFFSFLTRLRSLHTVVFIANSSPCFALSRRIQRIASHYHKVAYFPPLSHITMPVELRKRKAPAAPPPPPVKRKATGKTGKAAKAKEAAAKVAEKEDNPEKVEEPKEETKEEAKEEEKTEEEPKTEEPKAQEAKKSGGKVEVGDIVDLDTFGGEIETNDGDKTTLKKLVDESKSGVVLFTYPKASTPGCTKQVCFFRDSYEPLTKDGLAIYGLSTDSPKANTTFKEKQKLPYPLLCDPKATLIGAIGLKKAPKGTTRGVFVISKEGKVLVAEAGSPQGTMDRVKALVEELASK
ncbi:unnamed protein product [Fusarium graminearum]|nr:unnamed protein product [Fusarium graminearum]